MSSAFNISCLKSESLFAYWIFLLFVGFGIALIIGGIYKCFKNDTGFINSIIKLEWENVKATFSGSPAIVVIGILLLLIALWISNKNLENQHIRIDARSVPWTVESLFKEVMQGYALSSPSGKVIIEPSARQVLVKGHLEADCATEFFLKLCDTNDELVCESGNWWEIWTANQVYVRRKGKETAIALKSIYFELGLTDINEAGMDIIREVAAIFLKSENLMVELSGYASPEGKEKNNVELAHQRAEAARKSLYAEGIPMKSIVINEVNIGFREPKKESRRVDILLRQVSINP